MKWIYVICLLPVILAGPERVASAQSTAPSPSRHISPEQQSFLDTLEKDTFSYFWQNTNPENGLVPDRVPDNGLSSIAAVGFALSAYLVGVENGYITRTAASEQTLTTLRFLWDAPQGDAPENVAGYKGFFYHFLDMDSGCRCHRTELSTIDTALLMAGVLSAQTYFDAGNAIENQIRTYADRLYQRIDWAWACSKEHEPLLSIGWSPEKGHLPAYWEGYNEAMILYILALGSPTHPIDPKAWDQWTATYNWDTFYGYPHVGFGPLFGHQYSHIWINFRGIRDKYMKSRGIDYFINSTRATYACRSYCIDNPDRWIGYNDKIWGLTASDGPGNRTLKKDGVSRNFYEYLARGAGAGYILDDGTIAPTAVGGSIPFAPEITIPTLRFFKDRFGDSLYGEYGFRDAFNLSYPEDDANAGEDGWFDPFYLAIDQGPILLMIENFQTDFLWNLMEKNDYIRTGLCRAGFSGGWLDDGIELSDGF